MFSEIIYNPFDISVLKIFSLIVGLCDKHSAYWWHFGNDLNVMVKLNVETGDYNCKYRDLESCSQQRETGSNVSFIHYNYLGQYFFSPFF